MVAMGSARSHLGGWWGKKHMNYNADRWSAQKRITMQNPKCSNGANRFMQCKWNRTAVNRLFRDHKLQKHKRWWQCNLPKPPYGMELISRQTDGRTACKTTDRNANPKCSNGANRFTQCKQTMNRLFSDHKLQKHRRWWQWNLEESHLGGWGDRNI